MIKYISKSKKLQFLSFQSRKSIVSPSTVLYENYVPHQHRYNLFHLHGKTELNTAYITLNREHKLNILSPTMIKELTRFLKSFEVDDLIRGIWMDSKSSEIFSKGTDFKMMANKIVEKKEIEADNYLRDLYDFAIFMGKYNKPLLININGEISNSAASIFPQAPFALTNHNTKWYLNETSLGYVPDCGSSYYLSRLPGELGTYLALTGSTLRGEDVVNAKLAYGKLINENVSKRNFKLNNSETDRLLGTEEMSGKESPNYDKMEDEALFSHALKHELEQRIFENNENAKQVLSEVYYKKRLSNYANLKFLNPYSEEKVLINHMKYYRDNIIEKDILGLETKHKRDEVYFPMEAINRCFRGSTIEEIIEALKIEDTEWSKKTLEKLSEKSPLSLKLTLRLVREGLKSQWFECFEREFRVTSRKIRDEDFKNGVTSILMERNKINKNWKYKKLEDISEDLVESYFRPLNEDLKIEEYDTKTKPFALYPIKDYYNDYPDCVRFYLNEDSLNNTEAREDYDYNVRSFLKNKKIDFENANFTTAGVREHIFKTEELNRKFELESNRVNELINSEKNIHNYYLQRKKYIEQRFENDSIKTAISESISKVYEDFFLERMNSFKEKCKVAKFESKKEFFLRLKQIIFKYNFTETLDEKYQNLALAAKNSSIPLFFPEKSGETLLTGINPKYSPQNYPAAEMTRFISRKTIKHPLNDYTELNTLVNYHVNKKDAIDHIAKNKTKFSEMINYRNFYEEHDDNFVKKREEYWNKFFLGMDERVFRQAYMMDIINCGMQYDSIRQYIKKNLKKDENLHSLTYENPLVSHRDIAKEFLGEMAGKELISDIRPLDTPELKEILEYNKKLWGILDDSGFDEKKLEIGKNLDIIQHQPFSNEAILNKFKIYIKSEEDLSNWFDPLFREPKCEFIKQIQEEYTNLLLKIYKPKFLAILKKETKKYGLAGPLMTKDGETYYEGGDEYMSLLDDFIENSNIVEFHKIFSTHILYAFSTLGLLHLEGRFLQFQNLHNLTYQIGPVMFSEKASEIYRNNGVKVKNSQEIYWTQTFLSDLTNGFSAMFLHVKDKTVWATDRMIDYMKYLKNKEMKYSPFFTKAIGSYQSQRDLRLNEIKTKLEKDNETIFMNPNRIKLDKIEIKKLVDNEIDFRGIDLKLRELYENNMDLNKRRNMIFGTFRYLKKLDSFAVQGQYGKFSFVKNDDQIINDLEKIPNYFDNFDQRKPLSVWFEDKLKHYFKQFFTVRLQIEENLNDNELSMFDLEMKKYFEIEKVKESIQEELLQEFSAIKYLSGLNDSLQFSAEVNEVNNMRLPDETLTKKIRNTDAVNQFIAFAITLNHKINSRKNEKKPALDIFRNLNILERLSNAMYEEKENINADEQKIRKSYQNLIGVDSLKLKMDDYADYIGRIQDELNIKNKSGVKIALDNLNIINNEKFTKDLNEFVKTFAIV